MAQLLLVPWQLEAYVYANLNLNPPSKAIFRLVKDPPTNVNTWLLSAMGKCLIATQSDAE